MGKFFLWALVSLYALSVVYGVINAGYMISTIKRMAEGYGIFTRSNLWAKAQVYFRIAVLILIPVVNILVAHYFGNDTFIKEQVDKIFKRQKRG